MSGPVVCSWPGDAWIETRDADGAIRTRGFRHGRAVESTTPLENSATAWLTGGTQRQVSTGGQAPALHGPDGQPIPARHWVAGASVRFADRVLGCLVVAQADRALTTAEGELLGALADQAAIAIENARLVDEARYGERTRLQSEKLVTVGQLAAGVAHEINNPLAAIRSAADLLSFSIDDADDRANVELIQNEAVRAAGIVRGMLDFVHPGESRATRVEPRQLVAATLRLRAYEHGIREIGVRCELDGLPDLYVDRNRVQQVLLNLIVNAEHALTDTPQPRILRIHGSHSNEGVLIVVEDTGIGMDADHLGRIFDPFFTTKGVGEGTGLGLSVSYGIMRELGGSITVASEPGQGAIFTLHFPTSVLAPTETVESAPMPHPGEPVDQPLRVLVVDDERSLRLLLTRYLNRAGHHVEVACDGGEALHAIAAQPPFDVIVTDLRMPHVDGPQLYLHLAEHRPELIDRVIFMSGDTVGQDTREFLAATRRPFLGKPFSLDELGRHISAVVRATRAHTA